MANNTTYYNYPNASALNSLRSSKINSFNINNGTTQIGGYSYHTPCNSIFTQSSQSSCGFEMPKKSFIEQLTEITAGLSIIKEIGSFLKGLFFPSKKSSDKNTTDSTNNAATAEKTALETAMNQADKTGDWTPVSSQVTQTEATYNQNQTAITACDTAISAANQIKTGAKGEIDKLKATNNDIDTKQIPDAKTKMESTISASNTKIGSLKAQISAAKAKDPNADTSKLEDAIKAEEDKIKTAKTDFEKTKTQLEDTKKQNNIKIQENETKIKEQDTIIKTQTDKKSQLTQANQKLQKVISEAKSKLDLHLGKTSEEK